MYAMNNWNLKFFDRKTRKNRIVFQKSQNRIKQMSIIKVLTRFLQSTGKKYVIC